MKDVGIRATTDLRHEAGEVLFAITPGAPDTALSKIRRALDLYLRFPNDPEFSHALKTAGDPRAFQLLASIQTLQHQVTYARALLEAKNETIAALQGRVVDMMSTKDVTLTSPIGSSATTPSSLDEVRLLGGAITLVPWETKGVRVNNARIFQWLQNLINAEEEL